MTVSNVLLSTVSVRVLLLNIFRHLNRIGNACNFPLNFIRRKHTR